MPAHKSIIRVKDYSDRLLAPEQANPPGRLGSRGAGVGGAQANHREAVACGGLPELSVYHALFSFHNL
jgi:hypothetical protein